MNAAIQAVDVRKRAGQWLRALMLAGLILGLAMLTSGVYASDDMEFDAAVTEWDGWVRSNLGKLVALITISVDSVVIAVRKNWSWPFGAVVLSMDIGVIVGIVNTSFTAVIQTQRVAMSEKTDLSHYIPCRLGDGAKSLFWEMDVAMIGFTGALVDIGLGFPVIGLFLGIGAAFFCGKLKTGKYPDMITHLLYWFTGFPEPKKPPGSHTRRFNR